MDIVDPYENGKNDPAYVAGQSTDYLVERWQVVYWDGMVMRTYNHCIDAAHYSRKLAYERMPRNRVIPCLENTGYGTQCSYLPISPKE